MDSIARVAIRGMAVVFGLFETLLHLPFPEGMLFSLW
jgi:hypothetical protein